MVCVNGGWFHDVAAAAKYGREGARKQERRDFRKARRELLENDHAHQLDLTQRRFNELVRLLDKDEPCISCGRYVCGHQWDAGHFITRGASSFLRFNFLNCYKQGSACNRGEERFRANAKTVRKRYEQRLMERFGPNLVNWLKAHQHQTRSYTIDELKQMRAMYSAEIRYIEQHGKPSRKWREFPPKEMAA